MQAYNYNSSTKVKLLLCNKKFKVQTKTLCILIGNGSNLHGSKTARKYFCTKTNLHEGTKLHIAIFHESKKSEKKVIKKQKKKKKLLTKGKGQG